MGLLDLLLGLDSGDNISSLKVGDWVEILPLGEEGEIIAKHGNEYEVEIDGTGGDVDIFTANELKKLH